MKILMAIVFSGEQKQPLYTKCHYVFDWQQDKHVQDDNRR